MPGYILHLTAAQMFLKTQKGQEFLKTKQDKNDFLIGNLLPDATQQKESSHFRDPLYREKMMVFPDLTRFTAKYRSLLPDSSALDIIFIFILTGNSLRISFRRLWNFIMRMEKLQI